MCQNKCLYLQANLRILIPIVQIIMFGYYKETSCGLSIANLADPSTFHNSKLNISPALRHLAKGVFSKALLKGIFYWMFFKGANLKWFVILLIRFSDWKKYNWFVAEKCKFGGSVGLCKEAHLWVTIQVRFEITLEYYCTLKEKLNFDSFMIAGRTWPGMRPLSRKPFLPKLNTPLPPYNWN